jgi:hypothetical protein
LIFHYFFESEKSQIPHESSGHASIRKESGLCERISVKDRSEIKKTR